GLRWSGRRRVGDLVYINQEDRRPFLGKQLRRGPTNAASASRNHCDFPCEACHHPSPLKKGHRPRLMRGERPPALTNARRTDSCCSRWLGGSVAGNLLSGKQTRLSVVSQFDGNWNILQLRRWTHELTENWLPVFLRVNAAPRPHGIGQGW